MKPWTAPILLFGFVFLAMRLLLLIDGYAVNVLYWDQWGFFEALFDDVSLWETFRWQHGPHRQGIGFVLARGVAHLSGWDTRADAFLSGFLVVAATAGFLLLRRRLLGRSSFADLAIPLLLLTPAQYGIFIHTVNASHSAAPLLLLSAYGLALSIERIGPRTGTIVVLNFLLIHTGFGLFAGFLTPCLFAIEALRARQGERAILVSGLVVSLLSAAVFFVGYGFDPSVEGFTFPSPDAVHYPRFVALMLANVCGLKGTGWLPTLVGASLLCAGLGVAGYRGLRILRGKDDATDRVVVFLIGFSLLFCLGTAVGRIVTGLGTAQSSRYVPLTAPFLLGILLHIAALGPGRTRPALGAATILVLVAASFPMRSDEARFMNQLRTGKQRWAEVYRETHDIAAADRAAGLKIYPWAPELTNLQQKLDWLEVNELNLFGP